MIVRILRPDELLRRHKFTLREGQAFSERAVKIALGIERIHEGKRLAVFGRHIGNLFAALLAATALLVLAPGAWGEQAAPSDGDSRAPHVAGELVVTYKPDVSTRAAEVTSWEMGASVEKELPKIRAQLLSFSDIKNEQAQENQEGDLEQVKQTLEQDPSIEAVEYNYIFQAAFVPNDPLFSQQYGLTKPHFPQAWDKSQGAGVKIAMVDTGIFAGHVDLKDKIVAQKDFVNNDAVANDDNGHGTHVSGIAAATTNNAQGVAGGCPDCKLVVAKVLGSDAMGSLSDVADGIIWSTDQGAKVINLSLGAPESTTALNNAVVYAASKGAVLVAAAGNQGKNKKLYPAALPQVIAVTATRGSGRPARFSNYGRWVDVAAPGVNILSTTRDGKYGYLSGTSMATPEVSALAGLLAAQGRSSAEIRARILKTAVKFADQKKHHKKHHKKHKRHNNKKDNRSYGQGRIDAALAVQ